MANLCFKMTCLVLFTLLSLAGVYYYRKAPSTEQLKIVTVLKRPTLKVQVPALSHEIEFAQFTIGSDHSLRLTIDGKLILSNGFLSCYSAKPQVDAAGDSFYSIKTEVLQRQCRQQLIINVSKNDETANITGKFEDCSESMFELRIGFHKGNLELVGKCTDDSQSLAFWGAQDQSERYFGLGEQFSYVDITDRPFSLLVREKGVGRGDQPISDIVEALYKKSGTYYSSYAPAPIWFGTRRLAWVVRSLSYVIWQRELVVTWSNQLKLDVITRQSIKQLVGEIANSNGYTPPVPGWVNEGAIVGLQGGTERVLDIYKKLQSAGSAITGLWLQDWVGKRMSLGYSRLWWNWELDKKIYSEWGRMRSELEQSNTKLLIYMNPMLTDVTEKGEYSNNYYKEAVDSHYLVEDSQGKVFLTSAFSDFQAGLIDLYKPEANKFYRELVKRAIKETGAMGMMTDFGESYPFSQNPARDVARHNDYPTEWLKLAQQAISEQLGKDNDFFSFSRAGYLGAPKWTRSLWAGDQNMDYGRHNGLPSCLVAMLTSGFVGYSNTHCDVGGYVYAGVAGYDIIARTTTLMTRWMQLAAFSPVFRTHEGNQPSKTLQVYSNEEMIDAFAFWSNVYRILSLYRREQLLKSEKQKLPLLRTLLLETDDDSVAEVWDQYYLGDYILVAPLLSDSEARKVYLPEGDWTNLWNGQMEDGCNCFRFKTMVGLPIVYVSNAYQEKEQLVASIQQLLQRTSHLSESTKSAIKSPPQPSEQEL